MGNDNLYPVFTAGVFLKHLEEPYIYNILNDELYEINDEALEFLIKCDGITPLSSLSFDNEFMDYCLEEKLLELAEIRIDNPKKPPVRKSPVPSLRYLELQITDRCNLACRHCYLGEPKGKELTIQNIKDVFTQFEELQGLRMIVSGGEPMLHRDFAIINEEIKGRAFRAILLTNGTIINEEKARNLNFQEVQISLDGLEEAHDHLRGKGNFKKAVKAAKILIEMGIDVSAATMITKMNANDFEPLEAMLKDMGVKEWAVDVPAGTGFAAGGGGDIFLPSKEASLYLRYGYGGGLYQSTGEYACGAHLCAITPDGSVCKCGFFADKPAGNINADSLSDCWGRIEKQRFSELECGNCEYIAECRGGCRFRAMLESSMNAPDSVKCFAYGIKK
ncbi:MAG: radical SAM protein [Candidatus Schekmanbacteria bacterium]|nr:radical SAM protein [Candidatus Schekmanbacteria bacterium]